MTDKNILGTLKVLEVTDNPDGTANVTFDISDEFKEKFMAVYAMDEWSDEVFEKFVFDALVNYAATKDNEDGND